MDLFFSGDTRRPGTRHGLPAAVTLVAILCSIFASPSIAAEVTAGLRAQMDAAPSAQTTHPVIVTLTEQVDPAAYEGRRQALIAAMKATARETQDAVVAQVDDDARRYWLVNAVAVDANRAEIEALAADPAVASVDLDRVVRVADAAPGQPLADLTPFPDAGEGNWGLGAARVPQVWRRFNVTGRGVVIGSIDTGVDPNAPELQGKVVAWKDFISDQPTPYDDNGHGTHTIGTMVGGAKRGAPIGVAPGATVVVAKAAGRDGVGPGSALLAAAQWMTDPDGNPATADYPVVVNNSWTAPNANDPWFRQLVRHWLELGIVPVFATGNNGPDVGSIGSPAGYPEVLAVGAAGEDGALTDFTARGPVTWQNLDGLGPAAGTVLVKPDIVAPGVNITSTVGNGYLSSTGTSMAAPHVSGLVALIAQANPSIRGAAAVDLIKRSAIDRGAPGPDPVYGGGQLNAEAAVAAAVGAPATEALETRVRRRGSARTSAPRVEFQVAVQGANSYRWRTNGRRWSAPRSTPRLLLNLSRGRQVVEVQAVDPVNGVDTTPARAVVTVVGGPPSAVELERRNRRAAARR